MKIIHLTPSYAPKIGGVETHVAAIAKLQQQDDHEVEVIDEGEFKPAFYPPLSFETSNFFSKKLRYKFYIWQQIWRRRHQFLAADIIHVHDVFWWILPLYPLIWRKVITTFHGWEGRYPVRWQAKLQRWFYSKLSRSTIHVGAWIQEFYWDKPTAVIYGGIPENSDPEKNDEGNDKTKNVGQSIKPLSFSSKKIFKFVFVGRLEPTNDVELFARAIRRWQLKPSLLNKKIKTVSITWVGDGSERESCQAVGKVTGQIKNPQTLIQDADAVLAASYLSILQAQAAGKLVCALYSNPLKRRYLETLPTAGGMIITRDVIALEEQLRQLLTDSEQVDRLNIVLQKMLPGLTWKNVVKQYYRLYAQAR